MKYFFCVCLSLKFATTFNIYNFFSLSVSLWKSIKSSKCCRPSLKVNHVERFFLEGGVESEGLSIARDRESGDGWVLVVVSFLSKIKWVVKAIFEANWLCPNLSGVDWMKMERWWVDEWCVWEPERECNMENYSWIRQIIRREWKGGMDGTILIHIDKTNFFSFIFFFDSQVMGKTSRISTYVSL
jgi:hypothetical protein